MKSEREVLGKIMSENIYYDWNYEKEYTGTRKVRMWI